MKCPNTELFLVRIFPHSDWIGRDTKYYTKKLSVFSPNAGKCGPEITLYLDTFHAVVWKISTKIYSNFLVSMPLKLNLLVASYFRRMFWSKTMHTVRNGRLKLAKINFSPLTNHLPSIKKEAYPFHKEKKINLVQHPLSQLITIGKLCTQHYIPRKNEHHFLMRIKYTSRMNIWASVKQKTFKISKSNQNGIQFTFKIYADEHRENAQHILETLKLF